MLKKKAVQANHLSGMKRVETIQETKFSHQDWTTVSINRIIA